MLEDRDYQEIAHMFKVIVESDIGPKLNKLAEGQQVLLETLAPKNRVEELEDEVSFLKSLIRMHSCSGARSLANRARSVSNITPA